MRTSPNSRHGTRRVRRVAAVLSRSRTSIAARRRRVRAQHCRTPPSQCARLRARRRPRAEPRLQPPRPVLPLHAQDALEAAYKRELRHAVRHRLRTTCLRSRTCDSSAFGSMLISKGQFQRLPCGCEGKLRRRNLDNVMCRILVTSTGKATCTTATSTSSWACRWRARGGRICATSSDDDLHGRAIRVADHCYAAPRPGKQLRRAL